MNLGMSVFASARPPDLCAVVVSFCVAEAIGLKLPNRMRFLRVTRVQINVLDFAASSRPLFAATSGGGYALGRVGARQL